MNPVLPPNIDDMTEIPVQKRSWFKIIRIVILLVILALASWYSYAWWHYEKVNSYEEWSDGMAFSKENGKYGYVNDKFKLVINHQFDVAQPFKAGYAITGTYMGSKILYRLIDKKGKYVGEFYDEIHELGEQRYKVRNNKNDTKPDDYQDYEWQLMDNNGKILSKKYNLIDVFTDDRARVCIQQQCGFINPEGREIVALGNALSTDKYQQIYDFSDGKLSTVNKKTAFSEGLAVSDKDGLKGYINTQGQVIIPYIFDEAQNFSNGLAVVKNHLGYGVIDKQGNFVILPNPKINNIGPFYADRAVFSEDNYKGLMDTKGNILVPPTRQYTVIGKFENGLALIVKNNLYGFIDKTGSEILPPIYDELGSEIVDGKVWAIPKNSPDNKIIYVTVPKFEK